MQTETVNSDWRYFKSKSFFSFQIGEKYQNRPFSFAVFKKIFEEICHVILNGFNVVNRGAEWKVRQLKWARKELGDFEPNRT